MKDIDFLQKGLGVVNLVKRKLRKKMEIPSLAGHAPFMAFLAMLCGLIVLVIVGYFMRSERTNSNIT